MLLPIPGLPQQANYFGPHIIESRRNDLNYIAKTSTRRNEAQSCQVTSPDFSKEFNLAADASDLYVGTGLLQEGKDKIYLLIFLLSLTNIRIVFHH